MQEFMDLKIGTPLFGNRIPPRVGFSDSDMTIHAILYIEELLRQRAISKVFKAILKIQEGSYNTTHAKKLRSSGMLRSGMRILHSSCASAEVGAN
jgi:hypothetical protein